MSSSRLGCYGLLLGGLLGMLLVVLFFVFVDRQAAFPEAAPAAVPAADVSLFLAEDTLSRLASQARQQPVRIDFKPDGRLEVATAVEMMGLEPVIRLGLTVERRGSGVVSQLHWARLGLIRLPADWLPAEAVAAGRSVGDTITGQIPPDFTLVGLTTTLDGLSFHLNWTPPAGP